MGSIFFPDNDWLRQVDHIRGYWNPKRKLGITALFSEITKISLISWKKRPWGFKTCNKKKWNTNFDLDHSIWKNRTSSIYSRFSPCEHPAVTDSPSLSRNSARMPRVFACDVSFGHGTESWTNFLVRISSGDFLLGFLVRTSKAEFVIFHFVF